MITKVFSILKIVFEGSYLLRYLKYKYQFPGLTVNPTATLLNYGEIQYKHGSSIGKNTFVRISQSGSFLMGRNCYLGDNLEIGTQGNISIGDNTTIQHRTTISGDVTIGRYCTFAPNVYLSSGSHSFDLFPELYIRDQDKLIADNIEYVKRKSKKVIVEDDCWLGINVAVMPGVTIGKGSVVGASSVVTKDIVPYSVVAGIPAKLIRKRLNFSPPSRIHYKNVQHFPYFYTGFYLEKTCREMYEGLIVDSNFAVSLFLKDAKYIHLKVKVIENSECSIKYGNKIIELIDNANEYQEVVYELNSEFTRLYSFSIVSNACVPCLFIEEAWLS
jgi:acetyltransferase-like isoleucine patch superfamily enzyme